MEVIFAAEASKQNLEAVADPTAISQADTVMQKKRITKKRPRASPATPLAPTAPPLEPRSL
jgi:hypothetical protein